MLLPPQSLSANGFTPWIIPNPGLFTPTLALMLSFSMDANLTADVQYTYDSTLQNPHPVSMTRVGTVLTVRDPGHGLIVYNGVGDAVALSNDLKDASNIWDAGGAGGTGYEIASTPDGDHYTITVANAGPLAATGFMRTYRLLKHQTLQGLAGTPPTRLDGPLYLPTGAVRMRVNTWLAGSATLEVNQGKGN